MVYSVFSQYTLEAVFFALCAFLLTVRLYFIDMEERSFRRSMRVRVSDNLQESIQIDSLPEMSLSSKQEEEEAGVYAAEKERITLDQTERARDLLFVPVSSQQEETGAPAYAADNSKIGQAEAVEVRAVQKVSLATMDPGYVQLSRTLSL